MGNFCGGSSSGGDGGAQTGAPPPPPKARAAAGGGGGGGAATTPAVTGTAGGGGAGGAPPPQRGAGMKKDFVEPSYRVLQVDGAKGGGAGAKKDAQKERVKNIFAKPLEQDDWTDYKPPVHDRTPDETALIRQALERNFVFESLSEKQIRPLIAAFETEVCQPDSTILKQGDSGTYFYIIQQGTCIFEVDGKEVGRAGPGNSFGELALLYNCPRAATVKAAAASEGSTEPVQLFRVDQKTFRYILQAQTEKVNKEKIDLLSKVEIFQDLGDAELMKLVGVMTPHPFKKDEYLMHKGDEADNFYIVSEGKCKICNITAGNVSYDDVEVGPGGYAGERAIMTGEKRAADMIALEDGLAFVIDKTTFATVFGNLDRVIQYSLDKQKLKSIKLFKDSELDDDLIAAIASVMKVKVYKAGTTITKEGEKTDAAIYILRGGKVESKKGDATATTLERGAYAGLETLTLDVTTGKNTKDDPTTVTAEQTLTVVEEAKAGVLTLAALRTVINTKYLGKPGNKDKISNPAIVQGVKTGTSATKAEETVVKFEDLKRHTILGQGTFGQVWLVSTTDKASGKQSPYALKIQSKYELIESGQAKAVVYEKAVMARMNHPFIIKLVNAYQDDNFVYMLMELSQGGELYNVITSKGGHGIPEAQARFYAAGIADGLGYMHKRGFVYRDLKPENVLIGNDGFPIIVDFGFVKYVKDKTYTCCGSPLYIAPEVILNKGHNWGADHWSLGVVIFEMLCGETPFYQPGMDTNDLFKSIARGKYRMNRKIGKDAAALIDGFLTKDTSKRLGNLAGGENDILDHVWFKSIDFGKLRQKEVKAPYTPKIKNPLDASNFENWSHLDDKMKQHYPKLKPDQQQLFARFSE